MFDHKGHVKGSLSSNGAEENKRAGGLAIIEEDVPKYKYNYDRDYIPNANPRSAE